MAKKHNIKKAQRAMDMAEIHLELAKLGNILIAHTNKKVVITKVSHGIKPSYQPSIIAEPGTYTYCIEYHHTSYKSSTKKQADG